MRKSFLLVLLFSVGAHAQLSIGPMPAPSVPGTSAGSVSDIADSLYCRLDGTNGALTAALVVDNAGGVNASYTETGIDRNSGSAATFNIQNSGAGAMTLQQDGVAVVTTGGIANQQVCVGTATNVAAGTTGLVFHDRTLYLDDPSTSQSSLVFTSSGVTTWVIGKGGSPTDLVFDGTATAEAMRIATATDYVGIGTGIGPAEMLSVGSGSPFRVKSTGHMFTPLGAAGTPSHSFTGDPDTGMWSPAANTLALSVAGAEHYRMASDGTSKFTTSTIYIDDASDDGLNIQKSGVHKWRIASGGAPTDLYISGTATAEALRIQQTTDNIGIGTGTTIPEKFCVGSSSPFCVKSTGDVYALSLRPTVVTVKPTCDNTVPGKQITYRKGSGGSEATSICVCEEVTGAYAWTADTATGDCT